MDPTRLSKRTRDALEQMPSDKRSRIEAIIAKTQTAEARAKSPPTATSSTANTAKPAGLLPSARRSTLKMRPFSRNSSRPCAISASLVA